LGSILANSQVSSTGGGARYVGVICLTNKRTGRLDLVRVTDDLGRRVVSVETRFKGIKDLRNNYKGSSARLTE